MTFAGIQKLTLLDYPGKAACTLFTDGCNFRCPFCQNSDLVLKTEKKLISEEEILAFLKKRQGILDGVCVTGGEPLLHPELESFLEKVKNLGFDIKIDTNGSTPSFLRHLIDKKLADYVAMDIKNSLSKYGETVGVAGFDASPIEESAELLMRGNLPYEFRTTVVKEFHAEDDFYSISEWLKGAESYYLQCFEASERVLSPGLHSPSIDDLNTYKAILNRSVSDVFVRGV